MLIRHSGAEKDKSCPNWGFSALLPSPPNAAIMTG